MPPCNDTYLCDEGLLLPLINESTWPKEGRAFLYCLGLLWCFLGVAIIADIFMCAIEKITSKTSIVKVASQEDPRGYEEIEVKVWNDTVANLTLMALGSSAPEILLSIIEIVGNDFHSGDLGPSTIVGSAAFNLLVITGVCCLAIPTKGDPNTRRINSIKVFAITAFFCVFAYVWLIIILVLNTEHYVDLWEAILTLLFFPILVILAYLAEKDFCMKKKKVDGTKMELGFRKYLPWKKRKYDVEHAGDGEKEKMFTADGRMNEKKMREFIRQLKRVHPNLSEEEVAQLAAAKLAEDEPHSRMWYRINATRQFGGCSRLTPAMRSDLHEVFEELREGPDGEEVVIDHGTTGDFSEGGTKAVIEFTAARSAILESAGRVKVSIRRYGRTNSRVLFKLETIDGTAEATKDYIPIKETMIFEKDETVKHVEIEIIDDNEWEPDEVFFVKISLDPEDSSFQTSLVGQKSIQEITIINDDEPGTFEFSKPSMLFKESAGKALIPVERLNGADSTVKVTWKTDDMTAHHGKDYEGGEGTLIFEHGETTKTLELVIYDDQEFEKDECFKVTLTGVDAGAKLGKVTRTIVTIVNDDDFNSMVSRLVNMTNMNMDALRVGSSTWGDQFRNALNVNGGDLECATNMDYVMHFLTFGWKVIFACVPPASIWGGWLAFFIALGMIGFLTAIIGDLAAIFGCLIGLKDSVTAITFVALGTSLPDLFASKQAAIMEKTADNSIGNVTGSNSVNVFLGLGLPWVIAAIYWEAQGKRFEVQAGSLSFSVIIYTICACICIALLMVRRYVPVFGRAELGGPFAFKLMTFIILVVLWVLYILLSSLQAYGHIPSI